MCQQQYPQSYVTTNIHYCISKVISIIKRVFLRVCLIFLLPTIFLEEDQVLASEVYTVLIVHGVDFAVQLTKAIGLHLVVVVDQVLLYERLHRRPLYLELPDYLYLEVVHHSLHFSLESVELLLDERRHLFSLIFSHLFLLESR